MARNDDPCAFPLQKQIEHRHLERQRHQNAARPFDNEGVCRFWQRNLRSIDGKLFACCCVVGRAGGLQENRFGMDPMLRSHELGNCAAVPVGSALHRFPVLCIQRFCKDGSGNRFTNACADASDDDLFHRLLQAWIFCMQLLTSLTSLKACSTRRSLSFPRFTVGLKIARTSKP